MDPIYGYLSLFLFSMGLVYIIARKRRRPDITQEDISSSLQQFKQTAERHPVDFERCEFRDGSWSEEVEEDVSNLALAARLVGAGSIAIASTRVETVTHTRTTLFYTHPEIMDGKRIYSVFPTEKTTLRYHVLEGHVFLYLSRQEPGAYVFDIEAPVS